MFDPCPPAGVPSGALNPVPPPPSAPAQRPPRTTAGSSRRPAPPPVASPRVYIAVVGASPETRYWQVLLHGSPTTPELRLAVGPLEIAEGVVRPADLSPSTYRTEDQLVRAIATRFANAAGHAEWDNRRDQAPVFHNGRWRILGALLLDTGPGEAPLWNDAISMARLMPLLPTDPRIPMPEPVRLAATADLGTEAADQSTAWGRYRQRALLELGDRRFDPAYAPLLDAVGEIQRAFEAVAEARRRRPRQVPRTAIAHALRLQLNPPPQQLLLTIPLGRMLERIRAWKRENEP